MKERNIFVAKPSGFCAGVERALRMINACIDKFGQPVYANYYTVHNKTIIKNLENRGVVFVKDINKIPKGAIIVTSAHGIPLQTKQNIQQQELRHIDTTCPLVYKVHAQIKTMHNQGYSIIYIGHKNHVETIGTCNQNVPVQIIETIEDIAKIEIHEKMYCVTQTTLSIIDTEEIKNTLKARIPHIQFAKKADICYATENRQKAVINIAHKVSIMFIFGSQESSNSQRLKETAMQNGCETAMLIEDYTCVPWNELDEHYDIGVSAGASCDQKTIQDFLDHYCTRYKNTKIQIDEYTEEDVVFQSPEI